MTGPGVGRGGSSRTALAAAAARGGGGSGGGLSRFDVPSGPPAAQFKWKADFAPMPAAEGMLLEWMAEPRVGLLLDLDVVRCQLAQADVMRIRDLADASGGATTAAATAARATTSRASTATGATAGGGGGGATAGGGGGAAKPFFWWCCWQCSACWAAYRRCLAMVVFLVLIARLPRAVTLWRLHMRSCYNVFPALANLLNAGRQIEGAGVRQAERQASRQAGKGGGKQASGNAEEDCFGSILVQVLGVKGKRELESGFAAHVLPLLPGGRRAHGGMRGGRGVEEGEVEEEEGLYRCSCRQCGGEHEGAGGSGDSAAGNGGGTASGMVITGVDPTDLALRAAFALSAPRFAIYGVMAFTGACSNRYKDRVEDAVVEAARQRLAEKAERAERAEERAEESGKGSVVEGGGGVNTEKKVEDQEQESERPAAAGGGAAVAEAVSSPFPRPSPPAPSAAPPAAAATSAASSAARLVPVISDPAVALFTYRAACIIQWMRVQGPRLNPPSYCTRTNPEAPALALPHPAHDLPSLLVRFGAIPKPVSAAKVLAGCGGGVPGWEEFPEGDRDALKAHGRGSALGGTEGVGGVEKGTPGSVNGEFLGVNTFQTGSFRDDVFDREEMLKEFNVGAAQGLQENGAVRSADTTSAAEGVQEYGAARALSDSSTHTPAFPTLADRVEEFLRRFSPKRQAKEGRGGPLARAITDWVLRLHLTAAETSSSGVSSSSSSGSSSSSSSSSSTSRGAKGEKRDMSWAALALGAYSPGKLKPMLRSPQEVDAFLEFMAAMTTLTPACNACMECLNVFNRSITPAAIVASFAFRPSSALLRCFLSVYCQHSSQRRELLDTLGIPPLPDLLPDRLVAPLLEGVLEHKRLHFLYTAACVFEGAPGHARDPPLAGPAPGPARASSARRRGGAQAPALPLHRIHASVLEQRRDATHGEEQTRWGAEDGRGAEGVGGERVGGEGGVADPGGGGHVAQRAVPSWPVFELSREAALSWAWTGEEERVRDWCVEIRQKERECEKISRWKERVLVDKMLAAAAGTAGPAAAGGESEVGGGLKLAPAYLVPWVGEVNPFVCLREMLLGESCYWELSNGRRVGVIPGAGSSAASAAASGTRAPTAAGGSAAAVLAAGVRCCAFPGCGRAEGPGRPPLKACSRCGQAAYCGRECQKAHWKVHKLQCQPK
ncbi:unnamed protein product [Closterium sp. Naga37s-1]|nr:unnamed protein product [Closterium sp. Naga37s-1]